MLTEKLRQTRDPRAEILQRRVELHVGGDPSTKLTSEVIGTPEQQHGGL